MDNTVDQQDSEINVIEEETKKKDNIEKVEEKKEEKIIKNEKEDNPIVDSTHISITETVSVRKDVEGNTNRSSTAEEKPTSNLSGPLESEQQLIELQQFTGKEQRQQEQLTEQERRQLTEQEQQQQQLTDNILFTTSPKSGGDISTSNNSNNPYYNNKPTMFSKPENQIASDSQSYAFYSETTTDIDPKHLVEISEDGMLSLRHVELENSNSNSNNSNSNYSSLISPGLPVEPLSSNTSNSNIILLPKQIIRIERDYCKGELCQFQDSFPVEIDGRVNPRRFQRTINTLNQKLEKAFDPKYNCLDNFLACVTIYTSTLCIRSHFEKMIEDICIFLDNENQTIYNPNGLNFRNPQRTSFLFLELEFY